MRQVMILINKIQTPCRHDVDLSERSRQTPGHDVDLSERSRHTPSTAPA